MKLSRALAAFSLGLVSVVLGSCARDRPAEDAGIEKLAAALGRQRLVETRLTGFDVYAPCSNLKDSERLIPQVVCAPRPRAGTPEFKEARNIVLGLERSARRVPAEDEARAEAALAGLVWSGGARSANAAVEALYNAVEREPRNARLLSDLAAAYYVRAQEKDEPQDLVRALDAAARAKSADPDLLEARFNLALILDRLHLRRTAEAAWKDYRELDEISGWAKEAARRLAALDQRSTPERWRAALPELAAAALRGDQAMVRRIVEIDPQAAREHAVENELGDWGERFLAQDQAGAGEHLRIASEVGEALQSITRDTTVRLAAEAVERAQVAATRAAKLARGQIAFREGMRSFRALRTREAGRRFTEAYKFLTALGTPVELWALAGWARCLAYESRLGQAEEIFTSVLDVAGKGRFPALAGWCHWGLGWLRGRQGKTAEALDRYMLADRAYDQAREPENQGTISSYLGNAMFALGQSGSSWELLYRALGQLDDFPLSWRWHIVLMDAARTADDLKLFEAGLLFHDERVLAAQAAGDATRLAESHWARSRTLLKLGRLDKAEEGVLLATRYARESRIETPRKKLLADVTWAQGEVLLRARPEAALTPLTNALEAYRSIGSIPNVAYISLARARLYRRMSRPAEAAADLEEALHLLESSAGKAIDPDLAISLSDSLQAVYDEWIDFQWTDRRNPAAALMALERARAFPDGEARGRKGEALRAQIESAVRHGIPADFTVIEYALLEDRLLIWVLGPEGVELVERVVPQGKVEDRIEAFLRAIQLGQDRDLELAASGLHALLLPDTLSKLGNERVLYFIPDKALSKVPFAALWNPGTGRFLIEDHPIAIAPSLARLLEKAAASPEMASRQFSSALLVGDVDVDRSRLSDLPDLPSSSEELALARRLFPKSTSLTGSEAIKAQVLEELDRHEMFIFAGHAVSNALNPSRSYLVLSPAAGSGSSDLLFGGDLHSLHFQKLRLIVLSACTSLEPRVSRSAGLAGMARPFLEAGADTVVGSLWRVEDREAFSLLANFYRAVAAGRQPVLAFRDEQMGMLKDRRDVWKRVRHWSAFEVVTSVNL